MFQDIVIAAVERALSSSLRVLDRAEKIRQGLGSPLARARTSLWGLRSLIMLRRMPDDPEEAISFLSRMVGEDPGPTLHPFLRGGR